MENHLLPNGTKPLPEPMLTSHQREFMAFSESLWLLTESKVTTITQDTILYNKFENRTFGITAKSPRV